MTAEEAFASQGTPLGPKDPTLPLTAAPPGQQWFKAPGSSQWTLQGIGVTDWQTTPGTQAPTPAQGAWNAGDDWNMNLAPASVLASMKQYAATHDDKYYASQIPTPAGSLMTPPATTPATPVSPAPNPTIPTPTPTPTATPTTTPTTTPAAITPPNTSALYQPPLVTTPGAGINETWANLLNLPSMSGEGGGSTSFPDLLKETQKKWGGFSASQF